MRTRMTTLYLCLIVLGAPAVASDVDAESESTDKAAGDSASEQGNAGAKQQDILDRAFSPLDNAVSDINRNLNKKDDGSTIPEIDE